MSDFASLGVKREFVKALKELNITEPTEVQRKSIPFLLDNRRDFVGHAQTGTGKTAAFGLPLLQKINPVDKNVQALILVPTRDLGKQISKHLFKFTKYSDKIFSETICGGDPIDRQLSALSRPTHIIVATPGRLIELIEKHNLSLETVKYVVLDEADEMLSMGFKKAIDRVLKRIPGRLATWMFSATMSPAVKSLIKEFLAYNVHRVEVSGEKVVNEDIEHQYIKCNKEDKSEILVQFLEFQKQRRGVIFCRTRFDVLQVAEDLRAEDITCDVIQGEMTQKERDKVMRAFRSEKFRVLIATDVVARGIDVEDLAFVVHYSLPEILEYYIHRSGRTGRAGRRGVALSLVTDRDMKRLRDIEKKLKININPVR